MSTSTPTDPGLNSLIGSVQYHLRSSDICTTATKGAQQLSLTTHLKAKALSTCCSIEELKIVGVNSNNADLGSADIKVSSNKLSSDWLRAVARMFNHLADNMDRLPTHEQTIATMVANRME